MAKAHKKLGNQEKHENAIAEARKRNPDRIDIIEGRRVLANLLLRKKVIFFAEYERGLEDDVIEEVVDKK